MMDNEMITLKKTARDAGLLYLIIILSGVYIIMYLPSVISTTGNTETIANNILSNEFLYRAGIFFDFVSNLFLKMGNYCALTLEMFWGIWLLPFGLIVYKSRFIPRIFGVLLIMDGIACINDSIVDTLFSNYSFVNKHSYYYFSSNWGGFNNFIVIN